MEIINYFENDQQEKLQEALLACDWNAARFLVDLLKKGTFFEMLGGWGKLLLLLDGEELISFATLTGQDSVRDETLTPWIGFVFTKPQHRGHRYAGLLLNKAESLAKELGYGQIYLGTDHIGLYEKYGYVYRDNRLDYWGEDTRIYCKSL